MLLVYHFRCYAISCKNKLYINSFIININNKVFYCILQLQTFFLCRLTNVKFTNFILVCHAADLLSGWNLFSRCEVCFIAGMRIWNLGIVWVLHWNCTTILKVNATPASQTSVHRIGFQLVICCLKQSLYLSGNNSSASYSNFRTIRVRRHTHPLHFVDVRTECCPFHSSCTI